jgi:nucleoside-diphosphate-sugar epimerase
MNIFITGASGFLGKSLAKKIISEGHTVRLLARNKNTVRDLEAMGAEIVLGNVEKFNDDFLKDIDFVYHFAAIRYEWGFSWDEYYGTNVLGTKNLLEASLKNNIKKFIYCSSVFVFGYPPKMPADESFPYAPSTLYAKSKVEAEKIVKIYAKKGLNTTTIRPTIVYGSGDTAGMLLKLCRLINNNMFVMVGSGENYLHLTHIDDLLQGLELSLRAEKDTDYIICSPDPITQKNLAHLISKELDRKITSFRIPFFIAKFCGFSAEIFFSILGKSRIKFLKREPFITRSKVDILAKNQYLSSKKAQIELDFETKINYPEGIKNAISWYKKNGYL